MDFDLSWVLWGLPIAFVLGWLASRLDLRQLRIENRQAPKAYFRGLNFLLNEQQDQAIDAFIEAVQNDPDTSELHFALGNLFRRRGEYERAVRVHEHLLSRGDLSARRPAPRPACAGAGLPQGRPARPRRGGPAQAAKARPSRRRRCWRCWRSTSARATGPRPARSPSKLDAAGQGRLQRPAGALPVRAGRPGAPTSRPSSCCAQAMKRGPDRRAAAASNWQRCSAAPATTPARSKRLSDAGRGRAVGAAAGRQAAGGMRRWPAAGSSRRWTSCRPATQQTPSLDVLEGIVALEAGPGGRRATGTCGTWSASRRWWRPPNGSPAKSWNTSSSIPQVQRALDHAVKPLTRYRCAACGFEAKQHFWQCPGCQAWDSYPARRVEEL